MGGLKEEISKIVALQEPISLLKATQLAVQSDDLVKLLIKGQKIGNKAPLVFLGNNKNEGINARARLLPIKRLTPEEMKLMRDKNLCFNCDETYHFGYKCKRLFLIWVEDEENELSEPLRLHELEDDQKESQVSLHIVASHTQADTIKLLGRAANKEFEILLDSGSTHSFLYSNVAKMLGG